MSELIKDDTLYEMLSERLYRHYCGEEKDRLSDKEVNALLDLMEGLQSRQEKDPYFNAEASWKRFQEKYLENPEAFARIPEPVMADLQRDMAKGSPVYGKATRKSDGHKRGLLGGGFRTFAKSKALRRVAVAVLVVLFTFVGMNMGTYATAKMGFLEFFTKSKSGWSFFVTGEGQEDDGFGVQVEDKQTFSTWEEVKAIPGYEDILIPTYIPEGMELEEIYLKEFEDKIAIKSLYENAQNKNLQICIEHYDKPFRWQRFINDKEYYTKEMTINGKSVIIYDFADSKVASFIHGDRVYGINGAIEETDIIKIIKKMQ